MRLAWVPIHLLSIGFGLFALVQFSSTLAKPFISMLLGLSFAGLAFVAHEALHGALVRGGRARYWIGFLGFFPFSLSPRLWIAWHNREHHSHTNEAATDPDCLATLDEFQTKPAVRFSTRLQKWTAGVFTLLLGFTVQSTTVLLTRGKTYLSAAHFRRALIESVLSFALWSSLLFFFGFSVWFWGYLVPLALGNAIVMAHIVTNHGLSPLALTPNGDDPGLDVLRTSLSVTVPRPFSFYTLDFGYHVEHHLLPGVSHRHGPIIRAALLELHPSHYQSLPLGTALRRYFRLQRVYKDSTTLLDPDSGASSPTLGTEPPTSTH